MKTKKKNIPLGLGLGLLALLLFTMFAGPHMPFVDSELQKVPSRWIGEPGEKLELPVYEPSSQNWLGSDKRGVDNLSKLVVAAKDTIYTILAITVIRYAIGVPLGLMAREKRGPFHWAVTLLNQVFSYLPSVFSVILLLALPFLLFAEHRVFWAIFIIAMVEAGRVAVTVQAKADRISKEGFVEAGQALGLSNKRLIKGYYIPGMLPELIINFCTDLGKVTILLGQLAIVNIFIGHEWKEVNYYTMQFVNTQYSWATLISEHRTEIYRRGFDFIFYPAFAMMLTILTFNLIGEGLRRKFQIRS